MLSTPESPQFLFTLSTEEVIGVFPFQHNWANDLSESWSWKTNIIESRAGTEQRVACRQFPRVAMGLNALAKDLNWNYLSSVVQRAQRFPVLFPAWQYARRLGTVLPVGAASISFPRTHQPAANGTCMMVWLSPYLFEVVEVSGVVGDDLSLLTPLEREWPEHALVVPMFPGVLTPQIGMSPLTPRGGRMNVGIDFRPRESQCFADVGAYYPIYSGYPLFSFRPNWTDEVTQQTSRPKREVLDNGVANIVVLDPVARPRREITLPVLLRGEDHITRMKAFLCHLRGAQKAFWLPSLATEFTRISNTSTQIVVAENGYVDHLFGNPNYRHIRVWLGGNRYQPLLITAAERTTPGQVTLTLSAPLRGTPLDIRFLHLVRLQQDEHQITYVTPTVARYTLRAIEVLTDLVAYVEESGDFFLMDDDEPLLLDDSEQLELDGSGV